jgi:hypothetical protein
MDVVPVALEQPVDETESRGEPRDALGPDEASRQEDGGAEILAALENRLGELDDLGPLRLLARLDGIADALLRLGPCRLLELEEREVVLEVRPTGRCFGGFLQKGI